MLRENYLVKKTTPLIYAEWSTLGANELKIIEVYLSRIDIKNGITSVKFTKKEFADLMGYADSRNLKTKIFDERLSKFMHQQIRMDLGDGKGYHLFTLFSDAKCYYDDEQGMTMVELDCNSKLAPVFLNLADGQNDGYKYISYRVEKTKNLKSTYSIRLYNLLLHHAWGKYQWIVELDELRRLIGATDATYQEYKYLNAQLLKKAQKEIEKHTDISFEYKRLSKGRITTGVIFTIHKKTEKASGDIVDGEAREILDSEYMEQKSNYDIPSADEIEKRNESIIEIFREFLDMINKDWRITDVQILEIGNRVYNYLPYVTEFYDELPTYKRELRWMNFVEDMLKKAKSENAKNLYPYLISQWERYTYEIVARD